MNTTARFDLKLDTDDKELLSRAASLMGTTMAGFVRSAAKEKAQTLLEQQSRVMLTRRDLAEFQAAIDGAFAPNAALQKASIAPRRSSVLEERHFDPKVHDRESFRCGETLLDEYLRKYAAQQSARGVASVFVLVDDATPTKIVGFYTLSAAQVDVDQLSPGEQKKLPKYPVPCFRLGRLARDLDSHGKGVGELLLALAVDRCREARTSIGAYALLVDAKNAAAKSFYERFGFTPFKDSPRVLYLPIR